MTTPRSQKLLLAVFAGSLLVTACTNTASEQKEATNNAINKIEDKMTDSQVAETQAEWEKERAAILADLRNLRDNIETDLAASKVELADEQMKPSVRADKKALQVELISEKIKVEALMSKAESATDATWTSTKADINKASDEVKSWWARLKENVDKKTGVDNDKDGH